MHFDTKAFGERMRELREIEGLSQEQLAEKLNISRGYESHLEIGLKSPSLDLLIDLSGYFDTSLDYLILGKQQDIHQIRRNLNRTIADLERLQSLL